MNSKHLYGEAKSVLSFDVNNKSIINQANLDEIFDHPDVKNRKIVTFSVIGAFRKGNLERGKVSSSIIACGICMPT